jgi:tetratricopeptide (TPR) repeat protein
MVRAKKMEPIKNSLLEQAHSPQAWDALFTQHSQAGTLETLRQELIPYIVDSVVAARYAACMYEENAQKNAQKNEQKNEQNNALDNTQSTIQTLELITSFLKPFIHPLSSAYQVCWMIFTSEDHDAAILERFLGTVAAPKKPHQVLLQGRDVESVLDMEAVLRLDYGLGLCLYRMGRIEQSKPYLESANDWAAVLGINQLLLVSQFDLGLFNALGGHYEDAERTFTQVISTGKTISSKVAKRAVIGRIWNAFVSGISLKPIPLELMDSNMSRIVQQTMQVFQNNTFG